ncbi:MAG TPA: tRNA (adenosine(37)-N6)-threonylcarbamoyltransferase complex dimerization subunit type 1 TsaB, partial [Kofleriaceae bacterium]|nr:tRNA (adenosine(37)-N6)-threonylcarbamoyltransferase complex dimerization subunit type 1 TsaB [Kofleriaceae bacterium]
GSFTGLRIGMATAKGLCFAAGLPMWTASSLAAHALDAADVDPLDDALVVPVFDARRGELCAGFFRVASGAAEPLAAEQIAEPAALADLVADVLQRSRLGRAVLIGETPATESAARAGAGELLARARITPSARSIARLALAGARDDMLRTGTPVYIRPSAAETTFPDGNRGSRLLDAPGSPSGSPSGSIEKK